MKINDRVMLKLGGRSYLHFINYMPDHIEGNIIKINTSNYHGKSYRPYLVQFDDGLMGWYHGNELTKITERGNDESDSTMG